MFDVKKMGERIRALRGKQNQEDCAKALGISRGTLSYYESGERKPDADIIYKMCEVFGVTADYLIGMSDVKSNDTELQAVCKYTGLSEEAIKQIIVKKNCTINFGDDTYGNYLNTLNVVLSSDDFYFGIIEMLCGLDLWSSEKSLQLSPVLFDFAIQKSDVARYKLTKAIEYIADLFDHRERTMSLRMGDSKDGKHNPQEK